MTGGGLWYWACYDRLDPGTIFPRNVDTPPGMNLMISPTGEPYGIKMIPARGGRMHMMMLDAYGNIYYDPDDRSLGIYIVCHPVTCV
jgi:hypothetical protein